LPGVLITEDMLDAGPDLRRPMVAGLRLLAQFAPAVALLVNPTLVASRPQLLIATFGSVCGISPDRPAAVLLVKEFVENLAVMHAGIGDRIAPDQFVFFIEIDVVLVVVTALTAFLGPTGVLIFRRFMLG
jgi:hypothetical protein